MMNARVLRMFVNALALLLGGTSLLAQHEPQKDDVIVYDRAIPGVTAPKPVYHPNAEYTDKARKKKIQGSVVVTIVVTDEGTVRDARIVSGLAKDLDKQALKAVSAWKFEPATKDGKPVAVRIRVEVDFRLY
ncbi:MAG TPA: energy transducer TonB [Candidatus Sulfotelmatobacter sp.]